MARRYDLKIDQGADFDLTVTWRDSNGTPIDLTGYTAALQIRRTVDAPDPPLVDLANGSGITLGGVAGTVDIAVPAADTRDFQPGGGVWDLELTSPGGVVTRLLQGRVKVSPEVTR